jgi:hypothetical protein
MFSHINRAIATTGSRTRNKPSSITGASLRLDYVLDFGGGISRTFSSVFDIKHTETRNEDSICANGFGHTGINSSGCADRVEFMTNPDFSDTFTIGGLTYLLDVSGFNVDGPFWTAENAVNTTSLFGVFKVVDGVPPDGPPPVTPVPLPAAAFLLIGALGVLRAVSRKSVWQHARRAGPRLAPTGGFRLAIPAGAAQKKRRARRPSWTSSQPSPESRHRCRS